jgi:hypothetical protein
VPSDDLTSVPGLEDKHLRVLARQHITDLRALTHADRRAIYQAMRNLRPRPTLEQISRWQDDARTKLEETATDTSEWHAAASFVVVFNQRHLGGTRERRVEVERTEVEPERNLQIWSGWDCAPICGWMLGQLRQADSAEGGSERSAADRTASGPAQPAGKPAAGRAGGRAGGRAQLRIDSAAIFDAVRRADVLMGGALVADPPTELVAPVRVVLTVRGARPGTRVQAVARILRREGPGWNPQDPIDVPGSGEAEFDLSGVPAGGHEMSLIAWAPDASAKPVSVRLPPVMIRSGPG